MTKSSRLWDSIVSRLGRTSRKLATRRKHLETVKARKLLLEKCEDRMLLSIAPITGPAIDEATGSPLVDEGELFTLTVDVTDLASTDTVTEWTFDWGDGTPVTVTPPASGNDWGNGVIQVDSDTWEFSHTYADGSEYYFFQVEAEITDLSNRTTTESQYYPFIPGDANMDGAVNQTDLDIVDSNLGITNATWEMGDFNNTGIVDHMDRLTVSTLWWGQDISTIVSAWGGLFVVNNVAPTLTIAGDVDVPEGSAYSVTLSASDPGDDTISSWTVDWGDGSTPVTSTAPSWGNGINYNGDGTWTATYTYATGTDRWLYDITASADDEDDTWDDCQYGFLVSTLTDELDTDYSVGDLSLREALYLASQTPCDDTIAFDSTLFNGGAATLTLGGTSVSVNSDVTIEGPGSNLLTIDANSLSRVFTVGSDVEATFSGMTITGGVAGDGGGIYGNTGSTITINDAVISANSASRGAGIYAIGNLIVNDTSITNNTASNLGGGIAVGGKNTLQVNGSSLSGNSATNYGGGIFYGGEVFTGDCEASINDTTFTSNTASRGAGLYVKYTNDVDVDGATFTENIASYSGGGIYLYEADVDVADSDFIENEARYGGGIYCDAATLNVSDGSNFEGNVGYQAATQSGSGGAIRVGGSGTASIADSSFTENTSQYGGAIDVYLGSVSISGSEISDNFSYSRGGGVCAYDSTVDIANSSIFANESNYRGGGVILRYGSSGEIKNSAIYGNIAPNVGGGIYAEANEANPVSVEIINSTVTANEAANGGGIYKSDYATVTLANSIVALNTATTDPDIHGSLETESTNNLVSVDPLFVEDASAGTDGIWGTADDEGNLHLTAASPAINVGDNTTVSTYGLTDDIEGNDRIVYKTVDIGAYEYSTLTLFIVSTTSDELDQDYSYGDFSLREAIYLANQNSSTELDQILFDPTVFPSGTNTTITLEYGELDITGDLFITGPSADWLTIDADDESRVFDVGAGIDILTFSDMTITGGYADLVDGYHGGGIRIGNGSEVTINDSVITENSAFSNGGGIYAGANSIVVINDSAITSNESSSGDSGGIYADGSDSIEINNSIISDNSDTSYSGAIHGVDIVDAIIINDSHISNNYTGIGVSNSTVEIKDSTISGNGDSFVGYAIYAIDDSTIKIDNSSITDNDNGIVCYDSNIEIDASVISGNGAVDYGGIYLDGDCDNSIITNSLISGNTVLLQGGGICTNGTDSNEYVTLSVINSTIAGNSAGTGGGIYKGSAYDEIFLENTIVAHNTATNDPDIHGALTTDNHNLVRIWTDASTPDASTLYGTTGTPYDPGFVDAGGDDYHLANTSSAINAGDNAAVSGLTDVEGNDRVIHTTVDIGAYEYELTAPDIGRIGYYLKIYGSPGDYPEGTTVQIEYSSTGQEGTWTEALSTPQNLYDANGDNNYQYAMLVKEPRCYRAKFIYNGMESDCSEILPYAQRPASYSDSDLSNYWTSFILTADVQTDLAQPVVTLKWADLYNRNDSLYQINVRSKGETEWDTLATDLTRSQLLNGSSTSDYDGLCWIDPRSNIETGVIYEYQIQCNFDSMVGRLIFSEIIEVGIETDLDTATDTYDFEDRGSILLVIDDRFTNELSGELEQLKSDLTGDGWNVISEYVDITDPDPAASDFAHVEIKDLIKSHYDTASENLQAVYLIGHIPVAKSGWLGPDGHYGRPMPADFYYADMDGIWTDSTIDYDERTSNTPDAINIPGDGQFDQNEIPAAPTDGNQETELQIGRIDMYDMDEDYGITGNDLNYGYNQTFTESEVELLRRYLDKAHAYRSNLWNVEQAARLSNILSLSGGPPFLLQTLSHLVGLENVDYFDRKVPTTEETICVFGTIGATGSYYYPYMDQFSTATLSGNEENFILNNKIDTQDEFDTIQSVFNSFAWSFSCQWEWPSHIMRGYLANDGYALTAFSSIFASVDYSNMALGDTVGKVQQNASVSRLYASLMGDPTLRQHMIDPVSDVTVSSAASGVDVQWTASADSGDSGFEGYRVYRASVPASGEWEDFEFEAVSDLVTGTSYNDTTGATSGYVYMVRAIKLEHTNIGSYFNASQGAYSVPVVPELDSSIYYQINAAGPTILDTVNDTIWEGNSLTSPTLPDYVASPEDTYTIWTGSDAVADADFDLTATPSIPLEVFQSARETSTIVTQDSMHWEFDVSSYSTVNVTLYFAEIDQEITGADQRVFDIMAEGNVVSGLDDYDIYTEAGGKYTSVAETFQVNVSDGILNLDLVSETEAAAICGIQITDTAATPNVLYQVNAGGNAIGATWEGDTKASPASYLVRYHGTIDTTQTIDLSGVSAGLPSAMFQVARETLGLESRNPLSWKFDVSSYEEVNVTLYFAEIDSNITGTGQRVFDIYVEGMSIFDYDIYAEAGGTYIAIEESLQVDTHDGMLHISLIPKTGSAPATICGIQITDTATTPNVLYQVNAGGSAIATWEGDMEASPSSYLVPAFHVDSLRTMDLEDVSSDLPLGMFQSARESETSTMSWAFDIPVDEDTDVDVTLYFAEIGSYNSVFAGGYVDSVGDRVFDIVIEGNVEEEDYDIFDDADDILGNGIGADFKAIAKTYTTTILASDDVLNIVLDASTGTSAGVPVICGIQIREHVAAMGGGMMMALPMISENIAIDDAIEAEDAGTTVVDTEDPTINLLPPYYLGHRHETLKPVLPGAAPKNNLERIDRIHQSNHRFSFGEKQGPIAAAYRYHNGPVGLTPNIVDKVLASDDEDISEVFTDLDFDFVGNLEPHELPFAELVASIERPFKHR